MSIITINLLIEGDQGIIIIVSSRIYHLKHKYINISKFTITLYISLSRNSFNEFNCTARWHWKMSLFGKSNFIWTASSGIHHNPFTFPQYFKSFLQTLWSWNKSSKCLRYPTNKIYRYSLIHIYKTP